jgi:hypothetical protein
VAHYFGLDLGVGESFLAPVTGGSA